MADAGSMSEEVWSRLEKESFWICPGSQACAADVRKAIVHSCRFSLVSNIKLVLFRGHGWFLCGVVCLLRSITRDVSNPMRLNLVFKTAVSTLYRAHRNPVLHVYANRRLLSTIRGFEGRSDLKKDTLRNQLAQFSRISAKTMGWAESVQYFAGSNLSRHSEKRTDQAYIVERLTNPTSKFIAFDKEANALLTADKRSSTVAFLSYADVKPLLDLNTSTGLGSAFEANGFPVQWLFLGNDEGNSDVAYFGIDAAAPEDDDQSDTANARRGALKAVTECGFPSRGLRYLGFPETNVSLPLSPKPAIAKLPAGTAFHPFRPYSFLLPYHEAAVVGTGRAVLDWNKSSKFCPACGQKTVCEEAGWKRICPKPPAGTDRSKMCPARRSTQSYTHPRLDNSIIVAIVSADGERLFLGRKARSPPK